MFGTKNGLVEKLLRKAVNMNSSAISTFNEIRETSQSIEVFVAGKKTGNLKAISAKAKEAEDLANKGLTAVHNTARILLTLVHTSMKIHGEVEKADKVVRANLKKLI